jgi:hypothetical protein
MARRQRKRVPPAIIRGPSDQSATPQPTAAVPLDARQLTIVVRLAWETDGSETLPPGRRFFSSGVQTPPAAASTLTEPAPVLQQPPQPWQDQADTPLLLKVLEEQEPPITAGGESPPNLPPSDGDTAGASQPDLSATYAGGGAFSADAKGVRPSEPDAGILPASAEQRPAAYRFELRGGKIDILPEPPEPEDRGFALGASGRSPTKKLSIVKQRLRVHGRRLSWLLGWHRSVDRSVLGCVLRASGGVAERRRAGV